MLQRMIGKNAFPCLVGVAYQLQKKSTTDLEMDCYLNRGNARAWSLAGRCVMDAWWQARQALRPERETLSFVTKLLFPGDEEKQKIGIDASKMDEEWAKRPDEVIEYCLRDAALPLDIMEEIQAIDVAKP